MVFLNRFEVSYPRRLEAEGGRFEGRFEEAAARRWPGFRGRPRRRDHLDELAHGGEPTGGGSGSGPRPAGATWRWTKRRCSRRRCEASRDRGSVPPRTAPTGSCSALAPSWPKPALSWSCAAPGAPREDGGGRGRLCAVRPRRAFAARGQAVPRVRLPELAQALASLRRPPGRQHLRPEGLPGHGRRDRVPTPVVQTSYLWTASDPTLAAVNGEDLVPDLALGRLPAKDVAEARNAGGEARGLRDAGRRPLGHRRARGRQRGPGGPFRGGRGRRRRHSARRASVEKVYVRDWVRRPGTP